MRFRLSVLAVLLLALPSPAAETPAPSTAAAAPAPAAEPTFISDAEWNRSARAAPTAPAGEQRPPAGRALLATFVALAVVVGLAVVALVVLRRFTGGRVGGRGLLRGRHCEIVDTVALGPRRAVTLLRVGDHLVVVGQSEHGLAGLGTLPGSAIPVAPEPPAAPSPPPGPRDGAFAAVLTRLLGKRP